MTAWLKDAAVGVLVVASQLYTAAHLIEAAWVTLTVIDAAVGVITITVAWFVGTQSESWHAP